MSSRSASLGSPPVLFSGRPSRAPSHTGRGPGRPSRAQSEQRARELLETALDLFLEKGFEGATIEALVDRLGMARRTVYARYGDKETLFRAALQKAIDDWVVSPERLQAAESADLGDTLLAVARLMVANVRSPSGLRLARIANAEAVRMPEIAAYLWDRTARQALGWLEGLFQRRLGLDPRCAADSALAFLILTVEGAFQMMLWQPEDDTEADRQLVFRTRLFLGGVSGMTEG